MKIQITKPTKKELQKLNTNLWDEWRCKPSTFNWYYDAQETAYVHSGKVKVKTELEEVEIHAGDLVVFPKGLSCTWEIMEPISKVYKFN